MRNTRKSGQILRSKKRPRPTPRSGRGSRTNSNTSHQIPARVIEADSARAVWVPDPRSVQLIQPGAAAAVITVPSIGSRRSQHHFRSLPALVRAKVDTRGPSNMTEALASKTCAPCRGGIPPLMREQAELLHAQAPDWQLAEEAHNRAELPVSQIPRGAYLPSKYPRISSRLRSLEAYTQTITLRLLGITGDRECCAPSYSREASCPSLNACRPSFHSLHLSAPLVRSARPR